MLIAIAVLLAGLQTQPAKHTIRGRISDVDRKPVVGAAVQLVRRMYQNGRPILVGLQQGTTDENGEYRLTAPGPGRYYLSASYRRGFGIKSTNYNVPEDGYPTIYYPGNADPAAAAFLDLPEGGSLDAIDLTLYPAETFKIAGRVTLPDGTPEPTASLSILPGRSAVFLPLGMPRQPLRKDGAFEIRGLLPGSYELAADAGSPDGEPLRARVAVQLASRDLEDVSVILLPAIEINGRVAVEDVTVEAAANLFKQWSVSLRPETDTQIVFSPTGAVRPDGTFTIRKVGPGDYSLEIAGLPADSYIKSAFAGRADVVEQTLRLYGQSPGPMDILISRRAGRIEGTIINNEDAPVAGATVVLVPEPRLREREALYKVVVASNGQFAMAGVRPGNYKVFAWPADEAPAYRDPDFIRDYENRGESIQVDASSTARVQVRLKQ